MALDTPTRNINAIANAAERAFVREIERAGKTWIFQPRTFKLPAPLKSYRPDFYVIEDGCFYEVVGTRQAYSFQREKIEAFRATYPHLRLEIANCGAWDEGGGPGRPRVSRVVRHRARPLAHTTLEKLRTAKDGSPHRALGDLMTRHGFTKLSDVARATGVSYDRLVHLTPKTVREVLATLAPQEAS